MRTKVVVTIVQAAAAIAIASSPLSGVVVRPDTASVPAFERDAASSVINGVYTDRVLVGVRPGVSLGDVQNALADKSASELGRALEASGVLSAGPTIDPLPRDVMLAGSLGMDRLITLRVKPGSDVEQLAAKLRLLDGVFEVVEVDTEATPASCAWNVGQWYVHNVGSDVLGIAGVAGADIRGDRACILASEVALSPVTVAVMDTGVRLDHPAIASLLVPGINLMSAGSPTDDGVPSHGTACAGVIGAMHTDADGISGVAGNVRIMPVKILRSDGGGSQTTCGSGITAAVDAGAKVISISIGWSSFTAGFRTALDYADAHGVIVVASTGNSAGAAIGYPARYSKVIAVGGTDNRDQPFDGGTTGPELDIVAPATGILTTSWSPILGNGYAVATGTSFSCPMVAGAAALVQGVNPSLSSAEIRNILTSTADDLGAPGVDSTFGAGRLNMERAMRAVIATLPCAVDVNNSGTVNIDDMFIFLNMFFAGDMRADWDRSLSLSVDDLFVYLNAWFRGCPA